MKKAIFISGAFFFLAMSVDQGVTQAGEVTIGPENKIPPYYKAGSGRCSPNRGYNMSAEAPNYPSTYPKMNLRVFNGEVIGFLFELDAKEGWKPWYNQPEGKPNIHEGSPLGGVQGF